jgi:PEGA domain
MNQAARLAIFLCLCQALFAQAQDQPKPNSQIPATSTEPTSGHPQNQGSAITAKGFTLEGSTPLKLRINRTISSADAHAGDTIDFEVLEEVLVNNVLVVRKGGLAYATVTEAQAKRRMARGGKLDINIDYVRLIDDEKAALRAVSEVKGGGHTGAMTGGIVATGLVFFPAAPFFLFMHGKDISIPKGTEVTAYVNGDMKLDLARFQPAQPVSATPVAAVPNPAPATAAQTQLQVTSTPDGADIEIDGGFVGNTPSTMGVAPGQHQLSVKKSGFKPWERKITVSSGQVNVNALLEPESK